MPQQQVGAQPLSFRNVQQVEQATQEPDASTTSSSSSIPLPADNITTTRQSASGVRPATSSVGRALAGKVHVGSAASPVILALNWEVKLNLLNTSCLTVLFTRHKGKSCGRS